MGNCPKNSNKIERFRSKSFQIGKQAGYTEERREKNKSVREQKQRYALDSKKEKDTFLENEEDIMFSEHVAETFSIEKSSTHAPYWSGYNPSLVDKINERRWLESQITETYDIIDKILLENK